MKILLLCSLIAIVLPLAANAAEDGKKLNVVATTGMVADLVREVGGERIEVLTMMGPGVDPHLYKPTSADSRNLGASDVIFYNGLLLEGRLGDLFARLARGGRKIYPITESVPENLLLEPEEFEGHYDPHLWFDVSLWAATIPTIVQGLSETDPEGAAYYTKNGEALKTRLAELHAWVGKQIEQIPPEHRILVTSHDAFNYFGRAYDVKVVGLQGVSTVSEAALSDMAAMTDFLKQQNVPAVFVEASVNPGAMRRVSEDAGIRIGGELFSDSMGSPGEIKAGQDVGTYEGMVRYNVETIVGALRTGNESSGNHSDGNKKAEERVDE